MTAPAPEAPARFVSIAPAKAECLWVEGDGGVRLPLYRLRASRPGGPVLLWGHAGGFAAGSYLPLLETLAADAEVYALDGRGHGGADAPDPARGGADPHAPYGAARYAADLGAVMRVVAARSPGRPLHYAAHSLNALACARLACAAPEAFRALGWRSVTLFEPPIFPSADAPVHAEAAEKNRRLVLRTRRRRRGWASPDALAAHLEGRSVFAVVPAAFRMAHARATLRPGAGGYELACAPEIEAAVYGANEDSTFRMLARFPSDTNLHLVSGDPDAGPQRDWVTAAMGAIAARLPWARLHVWAGRGHLMVFEDPDRTAALLRAHMLGA